MLLAERDGRVSSAGAPLLETWGLKSKVDGPALSIARHLRRKSQRWRCAAEQLDALESWCGSPRVLMSAGWAPLPFAAETRLASNCGVKVTAGTFVPVDVTTARVGWQCTCEA